MTDTPQLPDSSILVTDLQRRLDVAADPNTKDWFENYLKNVIRYRGVKTPAVTKIVVQWASDHGLRQFPDKVQLAVAVLLIEQIHAEDKFAGTLYIQKYLLRRLEADTLLSAAESLFSRGAFFDWSTTDWFNIRVLGPVIVRHGYDAARRIACWRDASDIWQQRASMVPFRAVVDDSKYHPLIEEVMTDLVSKPDRFIQTGIGWVISDLSKTFPDKAAEFVEGHFDQLSVEVIRRHTKYLPRHQDYVERKRMKS